MALRRCRTWLANRVYQSFPPPRQLSYPPIGELAASLQTDPTLRPFLCGSESDICPHKKGRISRCALTNRVILSPRYFHSGSQVQFALGNELNKGVQEGP